MRLRRIDAVRFGALPPDSSLAGIGDGLTVVVGPNEAGKTSYTTLVRHVLYGFPNARSTDRLYLPSNGDKRAGRLIFSDGTDEWAVERVDGTHGGAASVRGPGSDEFLGRLTAGVSQDVYRSIFGFGLDELADLGSLKDIQQRLYATAAGLRVDPQEVREQLRQRAEAIWSAQGRTKRIHNLNRELRDTRDRIRATEVRAEEFRAQRAELDRRTDEADRLASLAREARRKASLLASRAATARELDKQVRDADEERKELRRALEAARAEAESLHVDDGVLEQAKAIDDLAARASWYQYTLKRAEAAEERAREARKVEADALSDLGPGWDEKRVAPVPQDVSVDAGIDSAEERLREARRQLEDVAQLSEDARLTAEKLDADVAELTTALGIQGGDPEREAQVRLSAVAELLKLAPSTAGSRLPAMIAAGLALVMAIVGALMGDWLLVVGAMLPLGLAAWVAFAPHGTAAASADMLRAAGLKERPDTAALLALQSDLQRLLTLARASWEADGRRAVLSAKEDEAQLRLERATAEWDEWLTERKLGGIAEPMAARAVLREVRRAQEARERVRDAEADADRERDACLAYARKALDAGLVEEDTAEDAAIVAAAVKTAEERLQVARTADRRVGVLKAEGDRVTSELDRLNERTAKAVRELEAILDDSGVPDHLGPSEIETLSETAAEKAEVAEAAAREASDARAELSGRLEAGESDAEGARLRLAEAGLMERLAEAVEEYAVAATALRLVEETLALYERDRQPAIVQRAEGIFETMTGGRYPHVITPLGSFALSVEDAERRSKDGSALSRGTAEQLYLSLRLAYIENLRDAHASLPVLMDDVLVNFDDEGRQAAAAAAIAQFAKGRQVVFFTCHDRVASLFAQAAPDHVRLTLDRC